MFYDINFSFCEKIGNGFKRILRFLKQISWNFTLYQQNLNWFVDIWNKFFQINSNILPCWTQLELVQSRKIVDIFTLICTFYVSQLVFNVSKWQSLAMVAHEHITKLFFYTWRRTVAMIGIINLIY